MNLFFKAVLLLILCMEVYACQRPFSAIGSHGPISFWRTKLSMSNEEYSAFVSQELGRSGSYYNPLVECPNYERPMSPLESYVAAYNRSALVNYALTPMLLVAALFVAIRKNR